MLLGFFMGLYLAGTVWYYRRSGPLNNGEKVIVIISWPGLLALEIVLSGLHYAARKALQNNRPIEKEKRW